MTKKQKVVDEIQNTTALTDGITECSGYDFGLDGFGKLKVKFCPYVGKELLK